MAERLAQALGSIFNVVLMIKCLIQILNRLRVKAAKRLAVRVGQPLREFDEEATDRPREPLFEPSTRLVRIGS